MPYTSYAAIHPSYILNQAIYVNDAIKAIVALYQKMFGKGMHYKCYSCYTCYIYIMRAILLFVRQPILFMLCTLYNTVYTILYTYRLCSPGEDNST